MKITDERLNDEIRFWRPSTTISILLKELRSYRHPAPCGWTGKGGYWLTGCGIQTHLDPSGFCHHCGHPIEVKEKADEVRYWRHNQNRGLYRQTNYSDDRIIAVIAEGNERMVIMGELIRKDCHEEISKAEYDRAKGRPEAVKEVEPIDNRHYTMLDVWFKANQLIASNNDLQARVAKLEGK